ncbi:MAG: hypothetical protein GWN99_10150 [Gemmatimonadetes bacterium]|uniref:6-bladed beta-propeller n=1 Tax=Candidatus Kutchimonas denitrificans TaxID=3056748 RepID=A0AAE5C8N9_9BACT|nr:hypothetical protein [Gemmatimonadota bacterium]NIR74656.1 hypothetical protein [Candidatus Kutchimonas denitrificans]NIS01406.1 hypothetical protein [Gemmatimonadota bacterium]NIW75842.1 hypothetical protein [Gemmatimonadota bacterium]
MQDQRWSVALDLRIGTRVGDDPEVFGDIRAVLVDDGGNIFVLDQLAREVRVFDPSGRHVRTFGRSGRGPGELRHPIGMAWGPDSTIWVADPINLRYSVFDENGVFITSYRTEPTGYGYSWQGGFDLAGRFYEPVPVLAPGSGLLWYVRRVDLQLENVDSVFLPPYQPLTFELPRGSARVPFAARLVWVLDPAGHVWFAVTDEYRVFKQRMQGDTVLTVEGAARPMRVTLAERQEAIERLNEFARRAGGPELDFSRIPGTKPVIEDLSVDDQGRLWVRLPAEESTDSYDVFSSDGRYLGSGRSDFDIPEHRRHQVQDGFLYAVLTDSMDVPYVIRAKISPAPGASR